MNRCGAVRRAVAVAAATASGLFGCQCRFCGVSALTEKCTGPRHARTDVKSKNAKKKKKNFFLQNARKTHEKIQYKFTRYTENSINLIIILLLFRSQCAADDTLLSNGPVRVGVCK